jgi:plastocyanin domain-containing protein
VPFVLRVGAEESPQPGSALEIPSGAIRVSVGADGYSPARVEIQSGRPAVLAFTRPRGGNCGGVVVIPGLGIRRDLPVGGAAVISISPQPKGEIPFHCGVNMYQGVISVR